MSRRSRANRDERRRVARQNLPPNVKVGILVVVVAIVLAAVLLSAVQGSDSTSATTTNLDDRP